MLGWFKRKKKEDPKAQLAASLGDFTLPNFPAVANRVLGLLRDPDVPLDAAGDALAEDPGLSAKVLGIANSSAFALRHPVRSVSHATSLLGRSTVESLLLGVVVQSSLPRPEITGFDQRRFWRTAARRAAAARALADVLHPRTKSESFTASLLEDMAVPLIGAAKGGDYGVVLEQRITGTVETGDTVAAVARFEFTARAVDNGASNRIDCRHLEQVGAATIGQVDEAARLELPGLVDAHRGAAVGVLEQRGHRRRGEADIEGITEVTSGGTGGQYRIQRITWQPLSPQTTGATL